MNSNDLLLFNWKSIKITCHIENVWNYKLLHVLRIVMISNFVQFKWIIRTKYPYTHDNISLFRICVFCVDCLIIYAINIINCHIKYWIVFLIFAILSPIFLSLNIIYFSICSLTLKLFALLILNTIGIAYHKFILTIQKGFILWILLNALFQIVEFNCMIKAQYWAISNLQIGQVMEIWKLKENKKIWTELLKLIFTKMLIF